MTLACFQGAAICAAGALAAALAPPRGGWSALGCGLGGVALALAAGPLMVEPVPASGAAAASLAVLALLAALLGQMRLLAGRAGLLPGGLRGRLAMAAAPAFCAVTLAGLGPQADLARPASGFAVLLLAGLSMVAWRARAAVAGPFDLLQTRLGGVRVALGASVGFALSGVGLLAVLAGGPAGGDAAGLPPLAQVLLAAGASVAIGVAPVHGLARAWLAAAPPWLAGAITAGTVGPAVVLLLDTACAPGPGAVVLLCCGAASVALAGWAALRGGATLRDALWLALSGLIAAGLGAGGPSGLSGAALALMVQILLACLPASLGRGEALAVIAASLAPALLVGAAVPAAALVGVLAGAGGLLFAAFASPPEGAAGRDPLRWCVLILLLGGALALPAPLARLLADIAATGGPS